MTTVMTDEARESRARWQSELHNVARRLKRAEQRYYELLDERRNTIVAAHGPIKEGFLSTAEIEEATGVTHRRVRQIRDQAKDATEIDVEAVCHVCGIHRDNPDTDPSTWRASSADAYCGLHTQNMTRATA